MSRLDHRLEPEVEIRRFEVINGAMGRRRWSADDRARIIEETLVREQWCRQWRAGTV